MLRCAQTNVRAKGRMVFPALWSLTCLLLVRLRSSTAGMPAVWQWLPGLQCVMCDLQVIHSACISPQLPEALSLCVCAAYHVHAVPQPSQHKGTSGNCHAYHRHVITTDTNVLTEHATHDAASIIALYSYVYCAQRTRLRGEEPALRLCIKHVSAGSSGANGYRQATTDKEADAQASHQVRVCAKS